MKYAVQLTDVAVRAYNSTTLDPALILLQPALTDTIVKIKPEDTLDNMGILLDDSNPERLDAILRLLRMKLDERTFRVYQSATGNGSWKVAHIEDVIYE